MIWWSLFAAVSAFGQAWFWRWVVGVRRRNRHALCLPNIDRLERDLGMKPELGKQEWLDDIFIGPGARWSVDEPLAVKYVPTHGPPQIIRNPYGELPRA